ncbi:MAG: serine hydrolase, partial [Bacteroidales bacterium]|nr:serine hydrolase [Bacteroidales bacterium]
MKKRLWIWIVAVAVVAGGLTVWLSLPRFDYILPALRYRIPKIDHYPLFGRAIVAAGDPQPWPYAPGVASARIPDSAEAAFAALETTAYLVVKDGEIVLEQYWDGYADTLWSNSFSMAKSVVSLLVGCAIDDGYIQSVNQPVADFLPGGWTWRAEAGSLQRAVAEATASDAPGSPVGSPVETPVGSPEMNVTIDTAAVPLRIRDLLTMSAGFRWNESAASLFSPTTQIYYGGDLEAILNRVRFKERPGVYFEYQSGVTQLLAMVLTRAVGRPLADYASEKLWEPLGAEEDAIWSTDGKGVEKAFCCFNSNARDFARIGQLILQHGRWNGVPLVDSAYLRAAVTPADYLLTPDGAGDPLSRHNRKGTGNSATAAEP